MDDEDLVRDLQKTVNALRDRGMETGPRPDLDAYLDRIDRWHDSPDGYGVPLHAYLGMAPEGYAAMVEGGSSPPSEIWEEVLQDMRDLADVLRAGGMAAVEADPRFRVTRFPHGNGEAGGGASEPPYWEVEDEEDDDRDTGVVEAATR